MQHNSDPGAGLQTGSCPSEDVHSGLRIPHPEEHLGWAARPERSPRLQNLHQALNM